LQILSSISSSSAYPVGPSRSTWIWISPMQTWNGLFHNEKIRI
jgi:hypothetical protein